MLGARNGRWARLRALVVVAGCVSAASSCFFGGDSPAPTTAPAQATASVAASPSVGASKTPSVATPPPPTADVASARGLYREGRFGEAREAFGRVAGAAQTSDERTDALVGAATAAFEVQDDNGALASLEQAVAGAVPGSASGLRAAYLLLDHYNEAGRFEDGVQLFRTWAATAGASPIGPYVQNAGASALAGAGSAAEAAALWQALLADSSTSPALREAIFRAEASVARVNHDDAGLRTALSALAAASDDPGTRIELSEVLGRLGDEAGMVAQLRAVVSGSPASVYAGIALDRLAAGGYSVDGGQAGLVYYRHGSYAKAEAALVQAVSEPGVTAEQFAFRAFYLGATYEDTARPDLAVRWYDAAGGSGASSAFVHRARYWAARVTEDEGDAAAASTRYVQLATTGPVGEFSQEAAFRAGYTLYKSGDTNGALAAWDVTTTNTTARLEYWRGRALAAAGRGAEAIQAYRRAVTLGRYELHGLEAARELGDGISLDVSYRPRDLSRPMEWDAIASWLKTRIGGEPRETRPTAACELASVGLVSAAEEEIRSADESADTWGTFALLKEASGCGLTSVAAQLAVNLRVTAGVSSDEAPVELLRLSYPIDFAATLDREAKKAGVDPLFLASLVRQESFWDPSAGSTAGALGLTQVIPETGRAIAGQLGVADFEPSDLFRPALSLEFGAYYLGGELRTYNNPLLALAAYNAGPGPAARWAAAGVSRAADLVETIDYTETRNYVTYIYEAYAHYLHAWGPVGTN